MAELLDGTGSLDGTDASNTTRMAELIAPSNLNNGVRALEGMLARFHKDDNGSITLAGSATAYTMALNADTGAVLHDGMQLTAEVQSTNTNTTPTLNATPDGGSALGAKTITKAGGVALSIGDMQAGMKARFIYDLSTTKFELLNPAGLDKNLVVGAAGEITNALQPAFLATNSVTDENVTGDGTTATVDFDTEVFDQGGDFTGDTFTAPVTGKYPFDVTVMLAGITTAEDEGFIQIVTSNRTYRFGQQEVGANFDVVNTNLQISGACLADMDANDTVTVTVKVSGGTKVVDIFGGSNHTRFSGYLAT